MLITRSLPAQTEKVEIKLPYYSKRKLTDQLFRVNEDESVLAVSVYPTYASVQLAKKGQHFESALMQDAINGEPITEEEFEKALEQCVESMDSILSQLSPKA